MGDGVLRLNNHPKIPVPDALVGVGRAVGEGAVTLVTVATVWVLLPLGNRNRPSAKATNTMNATSPTKNSMTLLSSDMTYSITYVYYHFQC